MILHAVFGVVILYSFPLQSLTMDRPLTDYMMVMLADKTEAIKQPDKPKVRTKKPKPMAIKQAKPLPKQPEPPKPPPQEEPPPFPVEPEPPPPVVQEPEPVAPPAPEPEPVMPVQEPQAPPEPPVEPEPVVEAPPPLVAEAAVVEQNLPEPEPQFFSPALPPALNLPTMPPPEPEQPIVVSKVEEVESQQAQPEPAVHALLEEPAPEEPVFIPPVPPVIIVTEPYEGALLNATQGVTIRGTIDDPEIKTATVILNGARIGVEVHEGRFEIMLSNITEENSLLVEATNAAGLTGQSALVRFSTTRPEPRDIQVILSCKTSCADVRLTALKGDHPQSHGYLPFRSPVEMESSTIEYQNDSPYLARLLAIPQTESGVYTIRLESHPSQIAQDCDPHLVVILYGYHPNRVRARVFRPSTVSRGELSSWILARFLMPEGFFWDDDDWTTGQIEDSRSVTKFNSSLGIVWKELK